MVWYALIVVLTSGTSAVYARWSRTRWAERGIHAGKLPVGIASALGAFLGLIFLFASEPVLSVLPGYTPYLAAAAIGTWSSLATLSLATDVATTKVPRDAVMLAAVMGAVFVIATVNWRFALMAGIAVFLLAGVALLARMFVGGLGFSDIRILAAAGLLLGWWIPIPYLMYGLIAASILQLLLRLFAPRRVLEILAETPATPETEPQPVRARPLPFAPAIVISVTAFAIYAANSGDSACSLFANAC